MKSIAEIVKKEHLRLNEMLKQFENSIKESKPNREIFNIFKWNVEKHFMIEEKGIFESLQLIQGGESTELFNLITEHIELRAIIKDLEASLDNSKGILAKLEKLKRKMEAHEHFEDITFYPLLDETLNQEQIADIIKKCEEIISQ